MAEHRNQARLAAMARVQVSWQNQAGQAHQVQATVEDESAGGVGIVIAEPVPVGTIVEIKSHRKQFSGTVMHCDGSRGKFFLGIQRNT